MAERSDQAAEFQCIRMPLADTCAQPLDPLAENAWVFPRIDRKAMLVIADAEFSPLLVERELQLAALERDAILISEHRNQDSAAQRRLRRLPVDVEELGVPGCRAVLEH